VNTLRAAPACLLVAILACSDETPTDPNSVTPDDLGFNAAVTSNEHNVPFTWITHYCGETQRWEGTDHWITQYTETPSGNILVAHRSNYKGTVVSEPSGNVYKLRGHFEVRRTFDVDGYPYTLVHPRTGIMIGQGSAPNLVYHFVRKITINANGDETVERSFGFVTCP
jgi:hypothetical protein